MPRQAAPLIVFAVPEAETACRVTCVSYASAVLCTALSERFFGTERLIVLAACKTLAHKKWSQDVVLAATRIQSDAIDAKKHNTHKLRDS